MLCQVMLIAKKHYDSLMTLNEEIGCRQQDKTDNTISSNRQVNLQSQSCFSLLSCVLLCLVVLFSS